jgi:hypothetical protein
MDRPNDANLYQRMNNQPVPPVPSQGNQLANTQAEYWPPPPGFPPNYTGWGVSAGPATVKEPPKPITWPLVIGIICLVIALFGTLGAFSAHDSGRHTLDLDAAARPLIETGTGDISSSGDGVDDFNMTVNGKTLKLTQIIYYGIEGDINASTATAPYYILAAYLPNTKQVIESQIYDKQGGKLLANFTDFPDATGSYKASLKERYEDVATSFNLTLFAMVVLVGIAGWCGWIVYKRLRYKATYNNPTY